jgi:hypothetical protein
MSDYSVRAWNVERKQYLWNCNSNTEVHRNEIHSISSGLARLNTFVHVGVHGTEHKCISHLLVFDRGSNPKFVPMPPEVDVSFHYVRKRHDHAYYRVTLKNARTPQALHQITGV